MDKWMNGWMWRVTTGEVFIITRLWFYLNRRKGF
jgi:hypothetical protein